MNKLKLLIPLIYPAEVREARKRSYRGEIFLTCIEAHMPAVSAAEAPVVASVSQGSHDGSPTDYRFFDGKFFVRAPRTDAQNLVSGEHALGISKLPFPSHMVRPARLQELMAEWQATSEPSDSQVFGAANVRDWGFDPKGEYQAATATRVRTLILIDAEGWVEVREPRLRLSPHLDHMLATVATDYEDVETIPRFRGDMNVDWPDLSLQESYFSLGDLDSLHRWQAARSMEVTNGNEVTVHDPNAFSFDRQADLATRIARSFVKGVLPELPTKSNRFIDGWVQVRDAAADGVHGENQARITELVSRFAPEIEHLPLRNRLMSAVDDWTIERDHRNRTAPASSSLSP